MTVYIAFMRNGLVWFHNYADRREHGTRSEAEKLAKRHYSIYFDHFALTLDEATELGFDKARGKGKETFTHWVETVAQPYRYDSDLPLPQPGEPVVKSKSRPNPDETPFHWEMKPLEERDPDAIMRLVREAAKAGGQC
jgi:hypothetical protein